MVDQDQDDEDLGTRIPAGVPRNLTPAPIVIQVHLDPGALAAFPDAAALAQLLLQPPAPIPPATLPVVLVPFLETLRRNGAVGLEPSFDPEVDDLTPNQILRRRSYFDVSFPDNADVERAIVELTSLPIVRDAVYIPQDAPPSEGGEPLLGRNDQDLDKQWYIYRVRASEAWGIRFDKTGELASGLGVVIGDVDYGFRTTHQDLTNIEADKQFNSFDRSQSVDNGHWIGHGTSVLGLAGAPRNRVGMAGIAYRSRLWPVQANTGAGEPVRGDRWARGITYIRRTNSDGRRKVVLLENQTDRGGCCEQTPSTNWAIQEAIEANVVVVVAAGNGAMNVGVTDRGRPYEESGSILVGATVFDPRENPRGSFSNFGERITVSAPGDTAADLTCAKTSDTSYRTTFGATSGAAAKVAGACALMLQANPSLTHRDLKTILKDTGSEVGTSSDKPAGSFLDVFKAVKVAFANR